MQHIDENKLLLDDMLKDSGLINETAVAPGNADHKSVKDGENEVAGH